MREALLSNCAKAFIQKIIAEGHRLDGRNYNESRNLDISFGSEYGSCIVSIGETKVLAQVSCEVVQPKQIRPNEGVLYINVEISPMASPQFEANRQTDLTVYLNRLLEKCYKDSKCIDLESLCIVVEEKVWSLRVDIKVLNHDGNLIECSSIATLASLAHFKRPDVTRSGEKVIIHTLTEMDPIPTVLYHYPKGQYTVAQQVHMQCHLVKLKCIFFDIHSKSKGIWFKTIQPNISSRPWFEYAKISSTLISDPNQLEESVCTCSTEDGSTGGGLLVVGMNQYKELCLLDLSGAAIYNSSIVHRAIVSAAERCKNLVDFVKKKIISDDNLRQKRTKINFADLITTDHIQSLSKKDLSIRLKNFNISEKKSDNDDELSELSDIEQDIKMEESKYDVVQSLPHTAEIMAKKGTSTWIEISSESDED